LRRPLRWWAFCGAKTLKGEFEYINWLRTQVWADERVAVGPGDDCAVVQGPAGATLLLTTDTIEEGVHFELQAASPRAVGRKALAVNLSDIAAMAGRPIAAVVSVSLPAQFPDAAAEALAGGLIELARQYSVPIVGGDTVASRRGLSLTVTVLGEPTGRGPVLRSGARPGDRIMVTGTLGGSLAGKHLTFEPRVAEAQRLHELAELHAMIDISDGLAADLGHILAESRCGAVLQAAALPISEAAKSQPDRSPLAAALYDGEDFELLFAVPEPDARRLAAEQPLPVPLTCIGQITSEPGLWLADERGRRQRLEPRGFDHFRQ